MFMVDIFHQNSAPPPLNDGKQPPSYQATQIGQVQLLPVPVQVVVQRRRVGVTGRFCKALALALLLWLTLPIITQSVMKCHHRWRHWHGPGDHTPPFVISLPGDLRPQCSMEWNVHPGYPRRASQNFHFPHTTSRLLFLAQNVPRGSVFFKISEEPLDGVRVYFTATFKHYSFREYHYVCSLHRDDGAVGIGIFTPTKGTLPFIAPGSEALLVTTITLPGSSNGTSHFIERLEVDMPSSTLTFTDFTDKVRFNSVSLTSEQTPMFVPNLAADDINIKTSNSPIIGSFNASSSLTLITSNALIEAYVGLRNDDPRTTKALFLTSNGRLRAQMNLLRDDDAWSGGQYDITATTSNRALDLRFLTSPVNSTLRVNGKTSNAAASVSLHPAYEGKFQLRTSVREPRVETSDVEDPSGRNRKRDIQTRYLHSTSLSGEVAWGGLPAQGDSIVYVSSSNGEALLKL